MFRLPTETWRSLFSYLRPRDLAAVSLVSHGWQLLAFPVLYRLVHLRSVQHLEQLAASIQLDDSPFALRKHLRGLVVCGGQEWDQSNTRHDKVLNYLQLVLSNVSHLEYFAWEIRCLFPVVALLQAECLSLQRVHFSFGDSDSWKVESKEIFKFKNLSGISLRVNYSSWYNEEYEAASIASLLRACPGIQSIELDFDSSYDPWFEWSAEGLCKHLDDVVFPYLHTFRALGEHNPNWHGFFTSPEKNSLRAFFMRHPGLRAIGFGWPVYNEYQGAIEAADVESLFPSLVYLEAPVFLCAAIVASKLADQIESIALTDEPLLRSDVSSFRVIAMSARSMPRLRRLAITLRSRGVDHMEGLEDVLCRTPHLQDLKLFIRLGELDDLVSLLPLLPDLRELGICVNDLHQMKLNTGESGWPQCVSAMAKLCLRLRSVYNIDSVEHEGSWRITRGSNEEFSVNLKK